MTVSTTFDRTVGDVGNIIHLEHVNVTVPDLELAASFYCNGLGLTRDPYIDLGPELAWFNAGSQQFHIPVGEPQVMRGTINLAVPDLDALVGRLDALADYLAASDYRFEATADFADAWCPWGNHIRCHRAAVGTTMSLGLIGIDFDVAPGTAGGIGRFYDEVIGAPTTVDGGTCEVDAGPYQRLRFVESATTPVTYDGHHLAIYVAEFSRPHRWLNERNLIMAETDDHEYRFDWIVDPATGSQLFQIEHEVRSLYHRLRGRLLVNRDPRQGLGDYVPGSDALSAPRRAMN